MTAAEDPAAVILAPAADETGGRGHLDLVEIVQAAMPAVVAVVIVLAYLVQVIETGNTDTELGASLPVIVAAYFVVHASTTKRDRRGPP